MRGGVVAQMQKEEKRNLGTIVEDTELWAQFQMFHKHDTVHSFTSSRYIS